MNNDLKQRLEAIESQKAELLAEEKKLRQAVLTELRETVRRFDFTVPEVFGTGAKRSKAEAMYKSPYDDQTWTGKGRKPDWYKEAIEEGYSDNDMRIDS